MFSLQNFYSIFEQFLSYFPEKLHGLISIFLAILLVIGVYKVIRRQLVYLILLIILLPAAGPILQNVWEQILDLLRFLVSKQ
ncbi:MAG: hypothetical protein A3C85_00800 [Candidatus Doudnabacteria bacterium RIFCSPHIGHO2_02_FULL_48_21]|uniref:Uncharacterized protein n=1 Tax=Candidatus Doudnabacteria bacterium RIFCSPLOWO2_02_FULL_48_13 TaxID=1817845 RepID=A0A1F5QB64_9BACT|nr:MAG: hypothetical protein A3K05_04790 [Candidatus Doudnabacteria bacterium RIFCSPHIGHO2_01_48_18]OGE77301.1 MAG: hypothetical protein A2668_02640 [Candidatus Doudnabacteria bacterium RIFCSPHIGHO2_01_FULL_48_180]OGE91018.1 MAG: hypothetical protein A3F44_01690 [Candidatus Doudnabacteria bacterium RIFCSPHIGHO2_12_FULL_47_25]OGE92841.1 MAG: hypothetical protein A3C85_00800 [Candidatus Doudnabacteria bacterium RIFCSPHIGHO2_02_FULL_48_21]OGE96872.1 MAG: hypothetical protein A3A83_04035 [Candidatu